MVKLDPRAVPLAYVVIPALTAFGGKGKDSWSVKNWIGYYITRAKPWSKEAKRYVAWKQYVQTCFDLGTTFSRGDSVRDENVLLWTQAYFYSRSHADVTNVHKGVEDALVDRRKHSSKGTFVLTSDKSLAGVMGGAKYDKAHPRLVVRLYDISAVGD